MRNLWEKLCLLGLSGSAHFETPWDHLGRGREISERRISPECRVAEHYKTSLGELCEKHRGYKRPTGRLVQAF